MSCPYTLFYERPVSQFFQCLLNLFNRIHHERTVRDNWFLEGRTGDQHKAYRMILGLDGDAIAVCKFEQFHSSECFVGKDSFAFKDVCQGCVPGWDVEGPFFVGIKLK